MMDVRQRRQFADDNNGFMSLNASQSNKDRVSSSSPLSSLSSRTITEKKIPGSIAWSVLFVYHLVLFLFIVNKRAWFPPVKKTTPDGPGVFNDVFEEETARKHLDALVSFGQRTVGSYANEKLAKDYILGELYKIQKNTVSTAHILQVDEHNVSGQFSMKLKSDFLSVYRNLKNLVAKLDPVSKFEDATENSVLVNCHYDSVAGSPGAGDDASSCSLMLEVLRAFSQRRTPLRHSIIFLFNSAEENMLQASHGFITQHPWAKSVKAFVNLDAAGAGGWEIVFQAGPQHPWLIQTYAQSVSYPFASILGQEIFQGGLVPSDTDYQIFHRYGQIPGLDIAYVSNGYVYHTRNDRPEYIEQGCFQRGGDNLKSLLEAIASTPKLTNPGADRHGDMVFFDIVGIVMIAYPKRMATILNMVIIIFGLFGIIKRRMGSGHSQLGISNGTYLRHLLQAILGLFIMWIFLVLTILTSAFLLVQVGRPMSWFNHSINVFWLFVAPAVAAAITGLMLLQKSVHRNVSASSLESLYYDANIIIWSVFLAFLTYYNIGSAFLLTMWLWSMFFVRDCLVPMLDLQFRDNPIRLLILHLGAICLPTIMTLYLSHLSLLFFLPIMGRVGSFIIPDIAVGAMVALPIIFFTGFSANIIMFSSGKRKALLALSAIIIIGTSSVLFTDYGFPYSTDDSKPAYQRVFLKHIRRQFHDQDGNITKADNGLWFITLDYSGLKGIQKEMPDYLKDIQPMKCEGPYCGWPYLYPFIWIIDYRTTAYVPVDAEVRAPSVQVNLVSKRMSAIREVELTFEVTGPDHIIAFVSPHADSPLVRWSLSDDPPRLAKLPSDIDQDVYFIYYSHAEKPTTPWTFSLTFSVPQDWKIDKAVTDIAFAGHYMHGGLKESAELSAAEKRLPKWVTPVTWTAVYDSWIF